MSKSSAPVRSRVGTSRQPTAAMKATPASATARPTGVKSNIAKLPALVCSRKPDTIRFGGVPISVVMPPNSEPKASGISTLPGGSFSFWAAWMATGISSASAPTLFMKADSKAASPVTAAMVMVGPASAGSTRCASASTAPEVCRPRLSTSTQATVMTAGWPKPAKALSAGTSPAATQASSAAMATMS